MGFTVGILEVTLVQPDMVPWMIELAEDWLAHRVSQVHFLSSYSNFKMVDCVSQHLTEKFDEIDAGVQDLLESAPPAKAPRLAPPAPPAAPPPPAPSSSRDLEQSSSSSSRLPPPPPAQDFPDELLDGEAWCIVTDHGLDAAAVLQLKRLAAVSLDAAHRVLAKLSKKSDIAKPSNFVSVAARNALEKLAAQQ